MERRRDGRRERGKEERQEGDREGRREKGRERGQEGERDGVSIMEGGKGNQHQ